MIPVAPINSDADASCVVQRSTAFRAVSSIVAAADAALARSSIARLSSRVLTRKASGILVFAASVTHAVLVAALPAAPAPAGRFLFAIAGAIASALLLVPRATASLRKR